MFARRSDYAKSTPRWRSSGRLLRKRNPQQPFSTPSSVASTLAHRSFGLDDHEHKAAVGPFLDALVEIVTDVPDAEPTVVLSRTPNGERLFTRLSFVDASGQKFVLYPLPPLSGGVSINGDEEALGREFDQALNRIATRARATSIKKHVAGIKNERNKLLYASDRGVARVRELQDWYFTQVRDRVFRNLITYLLIDQHAQKQEFAQEALKAFLRIVWRESRWS